MRLSALPLLFVSSLAFSHTVIGIADGDTLTLLVDSKPLKIRLASIDAPERDQPYGNRARQSLSELCWQKEANYQQQDVDRYGRVVATVSCDGLEVNTEQVKRGMAWVHPRYNKSPLLLAFQETAFNARRGLWADSDPMPPWEWRKEKRTARKSRF